MIVQLKPEESSGWVVFSIPWTGGRRFGLVRLRDGRMFLGLFAREAS